VDHAKPFLRYVDADDIDDQTLDIDGMKVRNDAGDALGTVDGLIVDGGSGRTYYIVVNAGGWFKSKQFLLPIGEVRLDNDRDALVVNLTKDQVNRFPGFDNDEFEKLSEADIKRINDDICAVFTPGATYGATEPYSAAWSRSSYQYPDWWDEPASPRTGNTASDVGGEYAGSTGMRRERSSREERAEATDVSPHFEGRAQPGDVLGLETGGERTSIGETKEDENKRRQDAQDAVRKEKEK
jgi:hypothetical protein